MTVDPLSLAREQLPTSWSVARVRDVAKINAKVLPESTDPEYEFQYIDISAVSSLGEVQKVDTVRFGEAPSRARRVVSAGDILVSTVRTYLRAITRVRAAEDVVASTGFAVITPDRGIDADYLYWWINSNPFVEQIVAQSVGVSYPAINASEIARMLVPLPEGSTQNRIARYLERECGHLDALAAEQRHQRRLLEERFRSALVNHFIPSRRDDTSEMTRMKYLFEFQRNGIWGDDPTGSSDDVVCIRVADFDRFAFRAGGDSDTIRSVKAAHALPRILRTGDVLLEKSGGTEDKPVGCAVTYEGEGRAVCSNFVAQLRPRPEHNARFLGLLLAAHYQAKLNSPFVKQTTGIQNLDSNAYLGEYARVPSRSEQDAIVREVESDLDLASRALGEYERAEQLLGERKRAVITAAVTGQMEVA